MLTKRKSYIQYGFVTRCVDRKSAIGHFIARPHTRPRSFHSEHRERGPRRSATREDVLSSQIMRQDKLQAFLDSGGAFSHRQDHRTQPATPAHDRSRVGIAAQHLVAFDILMRGHNCSISAEHLAYDLIADIRGLRRVQVKARAFAQFGARRSTEPAYQFKRLAIEAVDLFAFVSIPEQLVLYRRPQAINANFLTIPASEFSRTATNTSWREATRGWTQQGTASLRLA